MSFLKSEASDSLQTEKTHFRKFFVGISTCPISITRWYNTDSLLIIEGNEQPIHYTIDALKQIGFTLGFNINNNISVQAGGNFVQQEIKGLTDKAPSPKGGNPQKYIYNYKANYLQVPLLVDFHTKHEFSFSGSAGVKFNFIYYESLSGLTNPVSTYNPNTASNITTTYTSVDYTDKSMKFDNIAFTLNLGGNIWLLNRRLGLNYFGSVDFAPIYKTYKTICNFSYYEISPINIKILYSF